MNFSRYIVLALKGCAMGMADVVPGVSGGTIAFISGIYEELLHSIRSVNATASSGVISTEVSCCPCCWASPLRSFRWLA